MIRTARVYELGAQDREPRWLVDRLWPRGVAKASLGLAGWAKDAAPSDELRRWFGHDPDRWEEFRRRYESELDAAPDAWRPLLDAARAGDLLLVHAARDVEHNNAVVLADHLRQHLAGPPAGDRREDGGESVCYLHLVCPECGYLDDERPGTTCRRCGAALPSGA